MVYKGAYFHVTFVSEKRNIIFINITLTLERCKQKKISYQHYCYTSTTSILQWTNNVIWKYSPSGTYISPLNFLQKQVIQVNKNASFFFFWKKELCCFQFLYSNIWWRILFISFLFFLTKSFFFLICWACQT